MDSFLFELPTKIIFNSNVAQDILSELKDNNKKRVLIILSDSTYKRIPHLDKLVCSTNEDFYVYFYKVDKAFKCSTDELDKLKKKTVHGYFDAIVSIGGGNVIDFAKVVSVALDTEMSEHHIVGQTIEYSEHKIFHIAVPTTFGTGSEVTKGAIMVDSDNGEKGACEGKQFFLKLQL